MSKYRVTWWLTTQYEALVEADSEEQAWEKYSAGQYVNGVSVADYSDEPYDEEIEEADDE